MAPPPGLLLEVGGEHDYIVNRVATVANIWSSPTPGF
jgi:hypothetical protein